MTNSDSDLPLNWTFLIIILSFSIYFSLKYDIFNWNVENNYSIKLDHKCFKLSYYWLKQPIFYLFHQFSNKLTIEELVLINFVLTVWVWTAKSNQIFDKFYFNVWPLFQWSLLFIIFHSPIHFDSKVVRHSFTSFQELL